MSLALSRAGLRMATSIAPALLARFLGAGWKSMRAIRRFDAERRQGVVFPAFLFLSVTQRCQYVCRGCWARGAATPVDMDPDLLRSIVTQSREAGRRFFGIMGGEPLLYEGLPEMLGSFRDCYFLLFTNGMALDAPMARRLRRAGNLSPLISVEGDARESDRRRGRTGVYFQATAALEACRAARLPFGVATSLCRDNLSTHATDAFVRTAVQWGAHYLWYYIYRPVGPDPSLELALTADQIAQVRHFLVQARCRHPIVMVDTYWDAEGRALCPAATGISHHINARGDLEPCPPLQVAAERIRVGDRLRDTFVDASFLNDFRHFASSRSRGCVLMDGPSELRAFVGACPQAVRDSSGRGTVLQEWEARQAVPGHDLPGREEPERSWAYRVAKRHWFFGFGAYG